MVFDNVYNPGILLGPKDCPSALYQELALCLRVGLSMMLGLEDKLHAHKEDDGSTNNLAITILSKYKNTSESYRRGT